ncbi:hypothetical protein [Bifidobacterium stellenboschense]|uniref:Uncharacterized protein n=1 Tax=Bifidobacterium stellenboschense TaxID=762211 RepID=A0A087DPQ4_9BIFI|nr:hypothetical protein [Bifidobacterium stellenboschense]KFI97504.1 hypothetical protein BSTEL_0225 [Bifidobacterium stellenboschense]
MDGNGNYVSGVPYTVEYDSKLVKVDNPTGVTGNGPIAINWTAVGNGGQLDASTQVTLTGRMRFYGPYTRGIRHHPQSASGRQLPPAGAKGCCPTSPVIDCSRWREREETG